MLPKNKALHVSAITYYPLNSELYSEFICFVVLQCCILSFIIPYIVNQALYIMHCAGGGKKMIKVFFHLTSDLTI